ncbi:hypothetical protein AGMMS4952_01900 [Spirochaetia bacterium]|nr:hypothetical protein AGMMS4952_01900 [Spirochaetia bacterium]
MAAPDQAALDRLRTARSRAETSRKQALDIDGPGYFPPDWKAAEDQYTAAKDDTKENTLGDVKKTLALYEAAAGTYDDLARRCLPLYYRDLSESLVQARDEAIDAGIEDISPNRLEAADQLIDKALALYKAGESATTGGNAGAENYYAAAEAAFDARDRYHALSRGAQAYRLREEIQERGFDKKEAGNFRLGDESLKQALAAYDGGDAPTAEGAAEDARFQYTMVLNEGWRSSIASLKASAEAERRKALAAKADVAVKKDFGDADASYTRGIAAFEGDDFTGSAESFSRSIPLFIAAAKNAEAKRAAAEKDIRTAVTRVGESEETAREAGILLQERAQ